MDEATFGNLVRSKLSRDDGGETLFFGQYVRIAKPVEAFERFIARERAQTEAQLHRRIRDIETPPAPHLLTVKSWQHGFTQAESRSDAERAARDALFLGAQSWSHEWVSAVRWRQCLEAFDSPSRWLALARAREDDGRVVEANAALAAARWLDPVATREAAATLVAARPPDLPARLREQPDPGFRSRSFPERHWHAWDMKNYALLDLPSLLAFESDENFSVRARVYRSLGQRPYPASIQALQEATFDPHPFARAQAIRSLGWCADPTGPGRLARLEQRDPDPHVRRAAEQAWQRIVGYWIYFGEWAGIMRDENRCRAVARDLVARGLPRMAIDVIERTECEVDDATAAVLDPIRGRDAKIGSTREHDYDSWFGDAAKEEEAVRGAKKDLAGCKRALAGADDAARLRALLLVSWHGHEESVPDVEALVKAREPIGWAARRTLRCMGRGALSQRRAPIERAPLLEGGLA